MNSRRLILFLLLFTVPFLTTAAKNSWYLPQSNQVHYLTPASKLRTAHAPVVEEGLPVQNPFQLTVPMPVLQVPTAWPEAPQPAIPSIGVTISLQHRSPPSRLGS